jgi:hypothetical protein
MFKVLRFWFFRKVVGLTYNKFMQVFKFRVLGLRFRIAFKVLKFWFFWKVVELTYNKFMQVYELKWIGALVD